MGVTEGDLQVYQVDADVILGNCTIPFVILPLRPISLGRYGREIVRV